MNTQLDPTEAARALDIVAGQRAALAEETHNRWWIWAALFAYVVGLFALLDFAPDVMNWLIPIVAVGALVFQSIPGLKRRTMVLFGRRAQIDRDAPLATRAVIFGVMLAVVVGMFLLIMTDVPGTDRLPSWLADHVLTLEGVLFAIILTPLAWLVDRSLRRQVTRTGR